MPLIKRSPEKWQAILTEVQQRSERRKQRTRREVQKKREQIQRRKIREGHYEKRRELRNRLASLNLAVRLGQYTTDLASQTTIPTIAATAEKEISQ